METFKPTVPDVLPLVRDLYTGKAHCTTGAGSVGGHLHVVIDDGNVGTGHIIKCFDNARIDACVTCMTIASNLMRMSKTQRLKIAKLAYTGL